MDQMNLLEYKTKTFTNGHAAVEILYHSDIGGREDQEDSYIIAERCGRIIAAVCDGMGGSEGGALASQAAAEYIRAQFLQTNDFSARFFTEHLDEMDARVYGLTDQTGKRLKAGTTIVSVLIDNNHLHWLSVGDSRLYIVRNHEVIQATKDHNYKEMLLQLLQNGSITQQQFAEEAEKYPALTSYIGMGGIKLFDVNCDPLALYHNDILLLTTDGLYHLIDVPKILRAHTNDVSAMMKEILLEVDRHDHANRDNTTFVFMQYRNTAEHTQNSSPDAGADSAQTV